MSRSRHMNMVAEQGGVQPCINASQSCHGVATCHTGIEPWVRSRHRRRGCRWHRPRPSCWSERCRDQEATKHHKTGDEACRRGRSKRTSNMYAGHVNINTYMESKGAKGLTGSPSCGWGRRQHTHLRSQTCVRITSQQVREMRERKRETSMAAASLAPHAVSGPAAGSTQKQVWTGHTHWAERGLGEQARLTEDIVMEILV